MTHSHPPVEPTYEDERTIQKLLVGVIGLLDTFSAEQRAAALYDFGDPRRLDWDIIPKPDRVGVSLHQLDRHQKVVVLDLVRLTVSEEVFTKILAIMQLEHVLRAREADFLGVAASLWRTSDSYFLSIFGRPGFEDTWSLRFLGHHVCLNITVVNQRWIVTSPSALGQQPVIDAGVLNPLSADEGLGFDLVGSLDDDQRAVAVVHDVAPADFVSRQVPHIGSLEYPDHYDLGMPQYQISNTDRKALALVRAEPSGIRGDKLDGGQRKILHTLIDTYLSRFPALLAAEHRAKIDADGDTAVHFAWAGSLSRGLPHYFRVQTDSLLIEMVNAVDSGNHIHSVVRDFDHDFAYPFVRDHEARIAEHGTHLSTRTISSEGTDLQDNDWQW
ncbi:DUF3500 domain-containing protein [Rhodococcus sp. PAMC28707]|uniref:DUF3500 domain-containing protein n=1 Tax=unclassified Rhodococcus (in: high G+C Gram-positive bacteria) TaxID=192944 RepID=UPI00109DE1FC|nr:MULTISPECIES: DUF3500 domain-containing protein [unclassified Rhodococcus (in: high G+C Gram-positive bacteria)]QCB51770.1 DUF3500 domain-containing protein [Rhodococcus sp. PAMC28705]QCB60062.1 DUF3500 domain-containing protein [Rhodococcus sp. PAMC28707]